MAAGFADGLNHVAANVFGENFEFGIAEGFHVGGDMNAVENRVRGSVVLRFWFSLCHKFFCFTRGAVARASPIPSACRRGLRTPRGGRWLVARAFQRVRGLVLYPWRGRRWICQPVRLFSCPCRCLAGRLRRRECRR